MIYLTKEYKFCAAHRYWNDNWSQQKNEEVFLGREISHSRDYSDQISALIDKNITKFVKNAEKNADDILLKNITHLHKIAEALLEFESISGNEMEKIIKGEKIVCTQTIKNLKVSF